jgi:predicted component of type VI protein secretion system
MSTEKTVMFMMPNFLSGQLACVGGTVAGRSWELTAGTFTIGRLEEHDLCLANEPGVSKAHAKIIGQGDHYVIVDCESRNGTLVNDRPVQRAELFDGDEIRVCGCVLRFTQNGGRRRRREPTDNAANNGPTTLELPMPAAAQTMATASPYAAAQTMMTRPVQAPTPMPMPAAMAALPAAMPMAMPMPTPLPTSSPATGRVLLQWYAAGVVGSLLIGGMASAALIAAMPEPKPAPATTPAATAPATGAIAAP